MITNRILKYIGLFLISVLEFLMMTFILILFSGDRMFGLKFFVIPSISFIHLAFAVTQVKATWWKKVGFGFLAGGISVIIGGIPLYFGVDLGLDLYGYWNIILFFSLATVVAWELIYQVERIVMGVRQKNEG